MKDNVSYIGAWLLAVGLAFALAFASPNEASVMGRLPSFMSQNLARQPVTIPEGLRSDRTLALITFQRGQREKVEGWITGLDLRHDSSIDWVRIAVRNDPGTAAGRAEIEDKLLKHFPAERERARLVPVFADTARFVRSAGLNSADQVYAVVVNREGDVLARAEGQYDADKADALRETLKSTNF